MPTEASPEGWTSHSSLGTSLQVFLLSGLQEGEKLHGIVALPLGGQSPPPGNPPATQSLAPLFLASGPCLGALFTLANATYTCPCWPNVGTGTGDCSNTKLFLKKRP